MSRDLSDIRKYYESLEIPPGAHIRLIRQAYRDLARVWHPDRFSSDPRLAKKAEDRLKNINHSYDFLEKNWHKYPKRLFDEESLGVDDDPVGSEAQASHESGRADPGARHSTEQHYAGTSDPKGDPRYARQAHSQDSGAAQYTKTSSAPPPARPSKPTIRYGLMLLILFLAAIFVASMNDNRDSSTAASKQATSSLVDSNGSTSPSMDVLSRLEHLTAMKTKRVSVTDGEVYGYLGARIQVRSKDGDLVACELDDRTTPPSVGTTITLKGTLADAEYTGAHVLVTLQDCSIPGATNSTRAETRPRETISSEPSQAQHQSGSDSGWQIVRTPNEDGPLARGHATQTDTPPANPRYLPNGSDLAARDIDRSFLSKFRVLNGTAMDAVVRLKHASSGRMALEFYVRAGSSVERPHIQPGRYRMQYSTGLDWDSSSRSFTYGRQFYQSDKVFEFTETPEGDKVLYSDIQITLHRVRGGNTGRHQISEDEFNRGVH